MRKWLWIVLAIILIVLGVFLALFLAMRPKGYEMIILPVEDHQALEATCADYDLSCEDVTVVTEDGLTLVGWYLPSQNGAAVIAQHGFRGNREDVLLEAAFLYKHGYGVLLSTLRAHDLNDSERFSWGKHEMKDFEAWYQYLLTRDDVDPDRIGAFAESMGGALTIKYASQNENIKVLVTHCAFSSMEDAVAVGVRHFTGLPPLLQ